MYPDPAFTKCFNWDVKKDPKGLKKVHILSINDKPSSKNPAAKMDSRLKRNRRTRKISVLRSSPSRPSRGGRGRAAASGSQTPATSSALQSPPRRAPVVPGLSLSSSASASVSPAAAASPNADTPTRRRARRRRGLLRCRNRNQGCTDNITFTTEDARNQHERFTCRALNQVCVSLYIHSLRGFL